MSFRRSGLKSAKMSNVKHRDKGVESKVQKAWRIKEQSDVLIKDVNTMVDMLEKSIERASLCVTTPDVDTLIKKYQGPILSRRKNLHTFELLALANAVGRAALENKSSHVGFKPTGKSR